MEVVECQIRLIFIIQEVIRVEKWFMSGSYPEPQMVDKALNHKFRPMINLVKDTRKLSLPVKNTQLVNNKIQEKVENEDSWIL